MARIVPSDRLEKVVAVAAAAFVEHGFHRTQMDDVARGLGVSKGTLYRSVDSKEALFAAVLTYADVPRRLPAEGPIPACTLRDLSLALRDQLTDAVGGLRLNAALAKPEVFDIGAEVEHLTTDLYAMMAAHRVRIMVLDRCAIEVPEVAADWYESGRYVIVDMWVDYLTRRANQVGSSVGNDVLARTIVELVTLWAVKMPWDPAPRPYPPDMAASCAAMVRNLVIGESS